ncbi:unnamed protein product [Ectocarpus sp. 12 AP-2014]
MLTLRRDYLAVAAHLYLGVCVCFFLLLHGSGGGASDIGGRGGRRSDLRLVAWSALSEQPLDAGLEAVGFLYTRFEDENTARSGFVFVCLFFCETIPKRAYILGLSRCGRSTGTAALCVCLCLAFFLCDFCELVYERMRFL